MRKPPAVLLLLAASAALALAAPWASTLSTATGEIQVANTQKNAVWAPTAAYFTFTAPASGAVVVRRVSGEVDNTLDSIALDAATELVWLPAADFAFAEGDTLVITCPAVAGACQVTRKALP